MTLSERLREGPDGLGPLHPQDLEAADELDRLTAELDIARGLVKDAEDAELEYKERADALEAALREVLAAQENYAKCHMAEENAINNYSGGQAAYSRATIAALARVSEAEKSARSLLEKTNDR